MLFLASHCEGVSLNTQSKQGSSYFKGDREG